MISPANAAHKSIALTMVGRKILAASRLQPQ